VHVYYFSTCMQRAGALSSPLGALFTLWRNSPQKSHRWRWSFVWLLFAPRPSMASLTTSNWELSKCSSCSGCALRLHRSGAGFHSSSSDGFSPVMLPYSGRRNYPVSSTPVSLSSLLCSRGSDKLYSFHRYWWKSSVRWLV
jgi:hypothetical protein